MTPQAAATALNSHLSWLVFAATFAAAGVAIGVLLGRVSMMRAAKNEVQLALERAARDIRLLRENRYGNRPGLAAYKVLQEAEYLTEWRSRNGNHLVKPSGESRMRPPGEPRSQRGRAEARKAQQRNQIFALINQRRSPDDTGVTDTKTRTHRRYE